MKLKCAENRENKYRKGKGKDMKWCKQKEMQNKEKEDSNKNNKDYGKKDYLPIALKKNVNNNNTPK